MKFQVEKNKNSLASSNFISFVFMSLILFIHEGKIHYLAKFDLFCFKFMNFFCNLCLGI